MSVRLLISVSDFFVAAHVESLDRSDQRVATSTSHFPSLELCALWLRTASAMAFSRSVNALTDACFWDPIKRLLDQLGGKAIARSSAASTTGSRASTDRSPRMPGS